MVGIKKAKLIDSFVAYCWEKWSGEKCSRISVYEIEFEDGKKVRCWCGGIYPAGLAPYYSAKEAEEIQEKLPPCIEVAWEYFRYLC